MAEDVGERDGELAEPEVDIGAADAGDFDCDEGFAGGEGWGIGEGLDGEGLAEAGENGGADGSGHDDWGPWVGWLEIGIWGY